MLQLWHRPATTALIRPLAWEPPYAASAALKKTKKKKKERKKILTADGWDAVTKGVVGCREKIFTSL